MVNGQLHVVRYYPYYHMAFPLMKELMVQQCDLGPAEARELEGIQDLGSLYNLVGHDFWVVAPCASTAAPGRAMEGTRLTVVARPPGGHEFTIRTPGLPARWADFDRELRYWFYRLEDAVLEAPLGKCTERILDTAVTIFYYWVHFAPLSRGSAACGYILMFSILHAAGFELECPMKPGVQWDWEAILRPEPESFLAVIKPWLLRKHSIIEQDGVKMVVLGDQKNQEQRTDELSFNGDYHGRGFDFEQISCSGECKISSLERLPSLAAELCTSIRDTLHLLNYCDYEHS
mmetsp:Transcript_10414/g.18416  ORF Transcript_10414/g.18416 Transcript_10414/m.18416 type:complete len:289 (+) Transcript_10414:814-1680(+)